MTIVPIYNRDYKSKDAVMIAFNENKDFRISDMSSRYDGKPVNKSDIIRAGIKQVSIRYNQLRRVAVINL